MQTKEVNQEDVQQVETPQKPYIDIKSKMATCVVYDKENGKVVHTHQIMTLPGANPPTEAELEAEACDLATRISGISVSKLAGLPVRTEDLKTGIEYKVDVKKKMLLKK